MLIYCLYLQVLSPFVFCLVFVISLESSCSWILKYKIKRNPYKSLIRMVQNWTRKLFGFVIDIECFHGMHKICHTVNISYACWNVHLSECFCDIYTYWANIQICRNNYFAVVKHFLSTCHIDKQYGMQPSLYCNQGNCGIWL